MKCCSFASELRRAFFCFFFSSVSSIFGWLEHYLLSFSSFCCWKAIMEWWFYFFSTIPLWLFRFGCSCNFVSRMNAMSFFYPSISLSMIYFSSLCVVIHFVLRHSSNCNSLRSNTWMLWAKYTYNIIEIAPLYVCALCVVVLHLFFILFSVSTLWL